ncbi:MAG: HAD-IIB family hydrolase [Bacilli bacterium]
MKLFVFDVDGTLVTWTGILRKKTISSINKRLKNGDAVAIASGRPYIGIKKYLDCFCEGKKFAIAANGGATYDYIGNVIDTCALTYKDFYEMNKKYADVIKSKKGSIYCYTLDSVGYFRMTHNTLMESKCNNGIPLIDLNKVHLKDDDVILKIMIAAKKENIEDIDFSYEKNKYHWVDSSSFYHEYVNKDADKARGVETLRKYLNLKNEDCYCFGDEMNDYLMVKNYDGVAMGNANEKVKKVAKFVTKDVKNDGVSFALENYIK